MLVGYARVSSAGQSLDIQREQLTAAGCERIFEEKKSGRSAENRTALIAVGGPAEHVAAQDQRNAGNRGVIGH